MLRAYNPDALHVLMSHVLLLWQAPWLRCCQQVPGRYTTRQQDHHSAL